MQYSITEFEALYKRCFPSSMRLAMSLLHEEDKARDVVQEVFLKLWESDIRVDNPMAFIIRSVRNASLNQINMLDTRERIRQKLTFESSTPEYDSELRNEEVLSVIKRLLTLREQQIVEKIYIDGMSYKEAAESLDISVSAVNKNIVSALKKLRNHFKTGKS
ncbi:MAG: sigma-70 family RNA polymerase sigma factor [Bacteroides sp.]|nr:sigma-70 family RNA polymerase sigma factor [Bacteroides sp.]